MPTLLLVVCLALLFYGVIRFAASKRRGDAEPALYILWVPGAAFLYACVSAVISLAG